MEVRAKAAQIQHVDVRNHGRSETQLQTASVLKPQKRWVSLGFWLIWHVGAFIFLFFSGFWWYPFNPTYKTTYLRHTAGEVLNLASEGLRKS